MYSINTDIINNNMKKIINNIDIINDYKDLLYRYVYTYKNASKTYCYFYLSLFFYSVFPLAPPGTLFKYELVSPTSHLFKILFAYHVTSSRESF